MRKKPSQHQRLHSSQQTSWLVTVSLLAALISARDPNQGTSLLGMGQRGFDTFRGRHYLSMMGGAKLYTRADGDGFGNEAGSNKVVYNTQVQGMSERQIQLSGDDMFYSKPSEGKLAFTTPSVKDLFNADLDAFNGLATLPNGWSRFSVNMWASIMNAATGERMNCQNDDNCLLKYAREYTPVITDIVPNQMYKDQKVDWYVNVQKVHHEDVTPEGRLPMEELSIDGFLNNWEETIDGDTRLLSWRDDNLRAIVGDQKPNKNSQPRARFITGDSLLRKTSEHCDFTGNDCWTVRTHAKIDSISANQGNTNGGQELTISGWGFENGADITIAGIDCQVVSYSMEQVTCITGESPAASVDGVEQPGQPGIIKRKYDPASGGQSVNFDHLLEIPPRWPKVEESLELVFEQATDYSYKVGQIWDGYFKAPETGNYKFYVSCNDACQLRLDQAAMIQGVPANPQTIAIRWWASSWREYIDPPHPEDDNQYQSEWIALTAGSYYRIDAIHTQHSGKQHFTASVEFEAPGSGSHKMKTKEMQVLLIDQDNQAETWEVIVTDPSNGAFYLVFQDPDTLEMIRTDDVMRADDSAWSFNDKIYHPYYEHHAKTSTSTTKTSYDENGLITTDPTLIRTVKYRVEVNKRLNSPSFANVQLLKDPANTSQMTLVLPTDIGGASSSAPLSGKYKINCPDPLQPTVVVSTEEIGWYDWGPYLEHRLQMDIGFLTQKIHVKDLAVKDQDYWENARRFAIIFDGMDVDMPQCYITTGINEPLTGQNPQFYATTIREFGASIMFEPIPQEMLYTAATRPQVLVNVEGIPAACANNNCDYLYVDSAATITGQQLSGNTLTITGQNLPTSLLDVRLGLVGCGATTGTATSITCTLTRGPAAGTYAKVEVLSADGLVPVDLTQVTPITVSLTGVQIFPNVSLNQVGGDEITIQASGLPQTTNEIQVTFSDNTNCIVMETSDTEAKCITEGFDQATINTSTPYATTVTVNSQSDNTQSVSLSTEVQQVLSISPATASPVLKQDLTITFDPSFPDISASLGSYHVYVRKMDYEKELNIVSYDHATKKMIVKFNGAPSDTYNVQIKGPSGYVGGSTLTLQTIIAVDSISPLQGSVLGGTLLTITGNHYGTVPSDNPVKVGDNYCLVEETSEFEIKCRIAISSPTVTSNADVIVFAKTYEEMNCRINAGQGCKFDYQASTSTVTGVSSSFDSTSNKIQVTVEGTGFIAGDTANTELWIDGMKQDVVSVDATTAVFNLVGANSNSSTDIKFYIAEGSPAGSLSYVSFDAGLINIAPAVGSSGGTLITVSGVGFGTGNQDTVNLYHVQSAQNICSSVEVKSYGTFTCQTIAQEISGTDELKVVVNGNQAACLNTITPGDCTLTQAIGSSPSLSSVSMGDASTINFSGSNFPTAGYDVSCIYQGVEGTVTGSTATDASCSFSVGVPAGDAAIASLVFTDQTYGFKLTSDANGQTLTNALSIGAGAAGLSCSFAGQCVYTVAGNGIGGAIQANASNKITVCGNECELDISASSGSEAACRLPPLATSYSVSTFDIELAHELDQVTWSGTGLDLGALNDGVNARDSQDNTSSGCYAEVTARAGYTFAIDQVKIFLNNLIDKSPYTNGNLLLQGSNDAGASFTTIHTYDDEIHEGWNTLDYRSSPEIYSTIRLQGAEAGSCRLGEVSLVGVEVLNDANPSTTCTAEITIDGSTSSLTDVTYNSAMTPSLTEKTGVMPRFGSVLGSETVTFTGVGFSGAATVLIDNRPCSVASQTTTEITCTTSDKPYVPGDPTLSIMIDGAGAVATRGLVYRYVSRWSDKETWGNDIPPLEGEAVEIPKGQHLLVDVPAVPKLSFVLVYGSLIFESNENNPNDHKTFDAGYIMVNGGYLEIGTEDFPYTSKLTITMHGNKADPYLPVYGNKVIAVRFGQLEMHGKPRSHVWTDMHQSAAKGDTSITLSDVGGKELDWQVGEKIVIASTDYDGTHSEVRFITSVSQRTTTPIIRFDEQPLDYAHFADEVVVGSDSIVMRAEVGLLSRNVVYRGDPQTSRTNQYGAHIMLHSPGDESVVGRIENCEFTDVGQAFMLGRYPIHFHMIGTVQKSYIKKNSVHQTYNRGTTLHGVHYLEVSGNVYHKAMGHTVFIEDAIETNNLIEDNLIIDTRESNSLLNTDQSPACIWITHPNNIIRGNHCAGSKRYAYWYDLQVTSIGPSFDVNVCPENAKIGEFSDNHAHSCGRYGLRIFHNLIPRQFPCQPFVADMSMPNDPYHANQVIPAKFYRLTSWKNGRNGAIAERVGAVEFHQFKTADNLLAGIEFSLTEDVIDGYAKIVDAVVIGKTANADAETDAASPHGIIGPRTENFTIDGARFYNYNFNEAAALGECSHCFHPAATDSGARTYKTSRLEFTDVTRRIKYQYPFRGIFHDLDGSLTGQGADTYATKGHKHVQQPECQLDEIMYDGVVCDPTVQIRRIAFTGYDPDHFRGQKINIYPYDKSDVDTMTAADTLTAYLADTSNRSEIFWKEKLKPSNGWAIPYVTGHRYRVTWANDLDFIKMHVQVSERWEQTDKEVLFVLPFVDAREAINVTRTDTGDQIMDKTLLDSRASWITGSNWLQNETDIREFQFVVNGADPTLREIKLRGLQCYHGDCPQDAVVPVPLGDEKYWSDPNTWQTGVLPVEGEDVHIEPGMNVILDIETPRLNLLTINGRLKFLDFNNPIHLHAKQIYIRAGELVIGEEGAPYLQEAQISLYGMRHEQTEIMNGSVITGNKVIYNTGKLSLHGKPRSRFSRLRRDLYKSSTTAYVEAGLDWQPGDQLYFAPTNHQWKHSEYKTIEDYNIGTGELTFSSPFEFYHFGQETSTATDYSGVDTRGEVRLLTRNIKIIGADEGDQWGCNIFTNDRMEFDQTFRKGTTQLDNVEVSQCSQENTYNAAIRFESTGENGDSYIKNTVVHNSQAWALLLDSSKNIEIRDSDFIGARAVGVNLKSISNVVMDGLFVADVIKREWSGGDKTLDKEACVAYCSYWEPNICRDNQLTNSIAAGCAFAGFVAPGHDCEDNSSVIFRDNVAHSGERVGAHIYPNPALGSSGTCYKGSHFSAYKNRDGGLTTMYNTQEMRMHDMVFIDNQKGVCLQTAGERETIKIFMTDVEIYGEDNNSDVPDGQERYCADKYGLMLFGGNRGGKPLHPTMASQLPVHKIKSYGSWGPEVKLTRVNFNNFVSSATRKCNNRQTAMQRNPYASDYIPIHEFVNTKFNNVHEDAMIWIEDPNPKWANPTDCIDWPCTAPENVVLKFEGAAFDGDFQPLEKKPSFQIVSDVEEAVRAYTNCQLRPKWSAAWCNNRNLGILWFESLDADNEDRSIQPVTLSNPLTGYVNKVNSMMDHMWDGFYTGQKRLSRFPVQIESLGDYTLDFTGTPANNLRFQLKADVGGIKVKIPYPNAGSYTVQANGVDMPYTKWDQDAGRHGELTRTAGCGENRYVGVENFLEFFIMPDCEITVVPQNAIMVSVRLDWTLEEFYAANGVDNFVDRMAAVLGVHGSQIKVVAVYQGSVIVEYFVETLPDDEEPEKTLNEVQLNFYDAVVSGTLDLGAPIIDAMANNRIVKTNYDGDHYQGKDGNIWDHLIDNNNTNGGGQTDGGNSQDGSSGGNGSQTDNQQTDGQGGKEKEQVFSKVTETQIVTQEEPAMTDTIKYLIVFLAVLSVALLIVIGYVAMRMCTKRRMKPINLKRRTSQPRQDFQYAGDDTKQIFNSDRKRKMKMNEADEQHSSAGRLAVPQTPIEGMTTENGAETNRGLNR